MVDNNKQDSTLAFGVKIWFEYGINVRDFMFIIIYGVRVMRSVLEEKTTEW